MFTFRLLLYEGPFFIFGTGSLFLFCFCFAQISDLNGRKTLRVSNSFLHGGWSRFCQPVGRVGPFLFACFGALFYFVFHVPVKTAPDFLVAL